ncbi:MULTISPECIES: ABC transporter permease [unclassified Curtobacterium]|uniref:ABC transporter permease n=1 Tax=unclassified Curtobacterium TaxID=257496 RepID=UPI00052AF2A8|nr:MULTISPECIES: ABC transporter permease [unclassified Curtobacterium]AIV40644.1 ABC transporter permease [Curtobacterium sp. MR_MD2014]MCM3504257.1 ABC transporter permease [Curtobacterium sp. ODYSSEY 48 V2]MCM3523057.1 ABC transporter permease [Curtobacterium sp. P97]MDB6428199.1 ABC transporter permease [Curtobacterium sp. 20TX0008]
MSQPEPVRRPVRPFALLGSELALLFRRRRTWAMLGALALVPVLIAIAVRLTTDGDSGGPAFLGDITNNGLFVAFTALTVSIPLFLPLTVGVVSGDTVAGEASHGTIRYLLVAPTGRLRFILVKYAATVAFCLAATLLVVLVGAAIGALLFPIGPVTLLSGTQVGGWSYAGRALLLALYVALSMLGLAAIGLFASTLTTVPVGAMAATVVLAGVSQVLDQLPQLDWLHPFLFSHLWLGFGDLLRDPIAFDSFGANALLQLGWVAVFGALAYGRFATKDVLS